MRAINIDLSLYGQAHPFAARRTQALRLAIAKLAPQLFDVAALLLRRTAGPAVAIDLDFRTRRGRRALVLVRRAGRLLRLLAGGDGPDHDAAETLAGQPFDDVALAHGQRGLHALPVDLDQ